MAVPSGRRYDRPMSERLITAVEMARQASEDHRMFRRHLRRAKFTWHELGERWTVREGSPQHKAMQSVLDGMRGPNA
jgi:hypothetical protein